MAVRADGRSLLCAPSDADGRFGSGASAARVPPCPLPPAGEARPTRGHRPLPGVPRPAGGRFEEGYILSRDPNPVAAMCAYVCSAPCERACRRGDIDRPLAIRAMKRFLVEWHEASGIPDAMPQITPRDERVAVVGAGPAGLAIARELALKGIGVTVFD